MDSLHSYHSHQMHRLFHSDFWHFEMAIWLHVLARTIVQIFVPILMLQLGYELKMVIAYFLLYTLADLPMTFAMRKLIAFFGAKKVFILSSFSIISYFLLFSVLQPGQMALLALLAFLAALYDSSFWLSHLYLFERVNRRVSTIRENTGWLYSAKRFADILGPIVGAIVLLVFGKIMLIGLSIVIFALSLIPLFQMKDIHDRPMEDEAILPLRTFFKSKIERRNHLSAAFFAMHRAAEVVIWPVVIFFAFQSIQAVALIPIIVSLTVIIFSRPAGMLIGQGQRLIIALAALPIFFIWILRLNLSGTPFLYLSILIVALSALIISMSLDTSMLSRGQQLDSLSAVTYHNASAMVGQSIFYLILFFSLNIFQTGFMLAAFAALSLFALNVFSFFFSGEKRFEPAPETSKSTL
ncbi:MAG: hypothetical protein Q8P45_02380 [Candidatus Harrisonbacteria bacterium]|nr:hypothetical protein [Candidatus Harrisonbacteria bacterium]